MPISTWTTFFDHFSRSLKAVPPDRFARAWNVEDERTAIYRAIIKSAGTVPAMSALTFRPERCRIDFMLGYDVPSATGLRPAFVPVIAVESENNVKDAAFEVDSLCALAAPVKLLITCAIWHETPPTQLPREALLEHWRAIHAAHRAGRPELPEDMFAVVVGERTRQDLRFYLEYLSAPPGPLPEPFHQVRLPRDVSIGRPAV